MNTLLKSIFLFQSLHENILNELSKISIQKRCQKGEILFFEVEDSTHLHILVEGSVKIYKSDAMGNEIYLHRFDANSLIAEMANFYHLPFPASALVEIDSLIIKINYQVFEKEFLKNPAISFEFIRSMAQKIKSLEHIINSQIILDASGRVAKFIVENNPNFNQMKRNDIAHILNITPVTLSRILKKFTSEGLIYKDGKKLHVHNSSNLIRLFNQC